MTNVWMLGKMNMRNMMIILLRGDEQSLVVKFPGLGARIWGSGFVGPRHLRRSMRGGSATGRISQHRTKRPESWTHEPSCFQEL